jgi:hypothetical protein
VSRDVGRGTDGLSIARYGPDGKPLGFQSKVTKQQVIVHRRIGHRTISQVVNVEKKEEESSKDDDDESDIGLVTSTLVSQKPLFAAGVSSFIGGLVNGYTNYNYMDWHVS